MNYYKLPATIDWTILLTKHLCTISLKVTLYYSFQQAESELVGHYPGHGRLEFTQRLDVIDPTLFKQVPVYQVLDTNGNILCDPDEIQVFGF